MHTQHNKAEHFTRFSEAGEAEHENITSTYHCCNSPLACRIQSPFSMLSALPQHKHQTQEPGRARKLQQTSETPHSLLQCHHNGAKVVGSSRHCCPFSPSKVRSCHRDTENIASSKKVQTHKEEEPQHQSLPLQRNCLSRPYYPLEKPFQGAT